MKEQGYRYIVVGAGFFGATVAERIANDLGQPVLVLESRGHLGGNSYSEIDTETGIEIHTYGSHIFHTRDQEVWAYVNRFSPFNGYRHQVLTRWQGQSYFMPINLDTICRFYGQNLSPGEARKLLSQEAAKAGITTPQNFEEKAISQIGRPLYEAFIQGYTQKQWGVSPTQLPESILNRLPIRTNFNLQYFADPYQGIPIQGYGEIFRLMLNHPLIEVRLNTDFFQVRESLPTTTPVIFTGALDRFFNYRCGELSWRGLRFERETVAVDDFQGTAVMNYADPAVPYTRIHEFKHYHPERQAQGAGRTLICREYPAPCRRGDAPFYPVNTVEDQQKVAAYGALATEESRRLYFGGRLGSYRYLDMDQTIRAALNLYHQVLKPEGGCP